MPDFLSIRKTQDNNLSNMDPGILHITSKGNIVQINNSRNKVARHHREVFLSGPSQYKLPPGEMISLQYLIQNFDSFKTYDVKTNFGTPSVNGRFIQIDNIDQTGDLILTVNNEESKISIISGLPLFQGILLGELPDSMGPDNNSYSWGGYGYAIATKDGKSIITANWYYSSIHRAMTIYERTVDNSISIKYKVEIDQIFHEGNFLDMEAAFDLTNYNGFMFETVSSNYDASRIIVQDAGYNMFAVLDKVPDLNNAGAYKYQVTFAKRDTVNTTGYNAYDYVSMSDDGKTFVASRIIADSLSATQNNCVEVWDYSGQTPILTDVLEIQDPADRSTGWIYGLQISADGNMVLMSITNDTDYGSLHLWQKINGTWTYVTKINNPSPTGTDSFGECFIATPDFNNLFVQSFDFTNGNTSRIFIFKRAGSTFNLVSILYPPAGSTEGSGFGSSMAVDAGSNRLFVSNPAFINASDNRVGAAYIYDNINGNWAISFTMEGINADSAYGSKVSILPDGSQVFISEPNIIYNNGAYDSYGVIHWYR